MLFIISPVGDKIGGKYSYLTKRGEALGEKNELVLIGQRIREIRISKGMTQAELAEAAHLATSVISDVELGKSNMWIVTFCKIVEALQVSSDSILRPDVPQVNDLYQHEYSVLLSDCTPTEIEALMRITKEIKETLRKKDN